MDTQFAIWDWLVFALYGAVLLVSGWWFNRKKVETTGDYFLAGNNMPAILVAVSVVATSQSAATFIGGPDQGYRGDLSYLVTNIGAIIAALFVAVLLLPKFYQHKVTTVYELLERRFGGHAKRYAGTMYLFGRVFASGARLFMAAIAVAMILFGNIETQSVALAVTVLVATALAYSVFGGIRTVIYSDALQCFVYVLAAVLVLWSLLDMIPANLSQIVSALSSPGPELASKLTLLNWNLDFSTSGVFTVWSALTGFVLLNIAAFGLDQDMTQRMLTCRNAQQAAKSIITSVLLVIPVMALFICIGLLLWVFYQRPDLMLSQNVTLLAEAPSFAGEKITVFMHYVLNELPAGVKGVVTIGVIAAALSTLNSGLNSMASVLVEDIYRPWREKRGDKNDERHYVVVSRGAMSLVAVTLAIMAMLCFYWQRYTDMPLLAFALSVMVFSYSGLLGVYFSVLFTRRGNDKSVFFALITGFLLTLMMQPYIMTWLLPEAWRFNLGFTWQLCIGTAVSFFICISGKPAISHQASRHKKETRSS